MKLAFTIGRETWSIACDPHAAPRTLSRLAAVLPLSLQLHTPKIAGSHVFWHAPFVEDVEGPTSVLDAPPGAFIYWPVRQFLEITFAPLQAETASVSVLGRIEGGLDAMQALGQRLREGAGSLPFSGELAWSSGSAAELPRISPPAGEGVLPASVTDATRAVWRAPPAEIAEMASSRAIMHPAGPVFMAESELRVLHETLWTLRAKAQAGENEDSLRFATGLVLARAGGRLRDFCHLDRTGAMLAALAELAGATTVPLPALLDESILTAGRLAAWVDLTIPWHPVNEAMRAALAGRTPSTPGA